MRTATLFVSLTTALLLPLTAATESQIKSAAPNAASSATAQLNFKIIIPKVLYLQVRDGDRIEGPQTVAIMSNSHSVALNASLRTWADGSAHGADGTAHGNVILNAGAGKGIAQEVLCTLDGQSALAGSHLVCTASMP